MTKKPKAILQLVIQLNIDLCFLIVFEQSFYVIFARKHLQRRDVE